MDESRYGQFATTGNGEAFSNNEATQEPVGLDELRIIAQRIGGDFGMKVEIGKSGEGSFFDPETVSITLDPEHIAKEPELAKFVVAHEGAHRAMTLGPRQLGLTREKIDELYSQIGFGYMHNVIEDCAVNQWVEETFVGLEPLVEKTYDDQFQEENAVLSTPCHLSNFVPIF